MSCGICRSLYPRILREHDNICLACGQEDEPDLHELAVTLEQDLEHYCPEPLPEVVSHA